MSRRLPLLLLVAAINLTVAAAEDAIAPPLADRLQPLPPGSVRLGGMLGEAIDRCLEGRIRHQDPEPLIQPFRDRRDTTEWRSEFWGKWFTSAVLGYGYAPDAELKALLDRAASGLLATQSADGYLGSYPDGGRRQRWDIWGRKYTLLGLLAWHEQTGDPAVLEAACRHADLLINEVGPGGASPFENDMWHGLASSSVLEPMVLLYRRTGRPAYLAFCEWLVDQWATPAGPDLVRKALAGTPVFAMFEGPKDVVHGYGDAGRSKAYEMMSCYEGLVELYRTTGTAAYGQAARAAYDNIKQSEITVIGSGSDWERWCDGARRQTEPWHKGMETCVTVTWIKFAAQLLRLTGEPSHADDLELSAYNALLGAQGADGRWWCHHTPLAGLKERAPTQCGMSQNCCVANGPRGLLLLPQLAVMRRGDGLAVNLYGPLTVRAELPAGRVSLTMTGDYPRSGEIRIQVAPERATEFGLAIRIPGWSRNTRLRINGRPQVAEPGGYADIRRIWEPGDVVELALDNTPRLLRAPGDPRHGAIRYGPLVLARDARLGDADLDAPVAVPAGDGDQVNLTIATPPAGIAMAFSLPTRDGGAVRLCDFASAGSTWSEESRYRVWMPLAQP